MKFEMECKHRWSIKVLFDQKAIVENSSSGRLSTDLLRKVANWIQPISLYQIFSSLEGAWKFLFKKLLESVTGQVVIGFVISWTNHNVIRILRLEFLMI